MKNHEDDTSQPLTVTVLWLNGKEIWKKVTHILSCIPIVDTGLGFLCDEWSCPKRALKKIYLGMGLEGEREEGGRGALTRQRMDEKKGLIVIAKTSREI